MYREPDSPKAVDLLPYKIIREIIAGCLLQRHLRRFCVVMGTTWIWESDGDLDTVWSCDLSSMKGHKLALLLGALHTMSSLLHFTET